MLGATYDFPEKAQLAGILEQLCQVLELSSTQFKLAESRYTAVGKLLTDGDSPLLKSSAIYPQGSISLGTTVKPLQQNEYDVDLVCLVPSLSPAAPPDFLKRLIGERLRSHETYRAILEEKPRCWRLNYANEFHLDITPAIPNPTCPFGGELVPDKALKEWKPSNPKGYRREFEDKAKLQPLLAFRKAVFEAAERAQIEDLPQPTKFKGLLKRCVQLCKRHRDLVFKESDVAPISVIITTLAAQSYAYCVANHIYDTELDVLLDVIRRMPQFIETQMVAGRTFYFVMNPTTKGENFAEKWNQYPSLAKAFFSWQARILQDFESLLASQGLDVLRKSMSITFGESPVERVFSAMTGSVSDMRAKGLLTASPGLGLSMSALGGVLVKPNTFYGSK